MIDAETTFYTKLQDPNTNQKLAGDAYFKLAQDGGSLADWPAVNAAIIERWSMAGLVRVKRYAWGKP